MKTLLAICSTNRDTVLQVKSVNVIKLRIDSEDNYVNTSSVSKEITLKELYNYIESNAVINAELSDESDILINGDLNNFPYRTFKGELKNNIPVIIHLGKDSVILANGDGKTIEIRKALAIQRFSKFANGAVDNGDIIFSKKQINKFNTNGSKLLDIVTRYTSIDECGIKLENGDILNISLVKPKIYDKDSLLGEFLSDGVRSASEIAERFTDRSLIDTDNSKRATDTSNKMQDYENNFSHHTEGFDGDSGVAFEIVEIEDRVELRSYDGSGFTGDLEVPANVTHICAGAFINATARSIKMPDTVIFLGENAFKNSKFEEIQLSPNITAIPFGCFMDTPKLKAINLNNITSIDNLAFLRSGIEEVAIDANIMQIGYEAFKSCECLRRFTHPGTLKKIRHHAFDGCTALKEIDLSSVNTIEQWAFHNTGLEKVKVNGEVNYIQTGTFTGAIVEIELLDGMYKIAADSVSNIKDEPIKWIVPMSVKNIDKRVFKEKDTIYCYRKSVAASSAIMADSNIVYIDDLDSGAVPSVIKKAQLLDTAVDEILRTTLEKVLSVETIDMEYNFQELSDGSRIKGDIPEEIFDIIGKEHRFGEYATDEDILHEKIKFRAILEHLHRVSKFDILPFSSSVLKLKDTFNTGNYYEDGKLVKSTIETLYSDEISKVLRIKYIDNKFESINGTFIVAKTKDTLRYICMDNKYTDIMCENSEGHDVSQLLNILRPGDTIGLNNIIQGVKYPEISAKSNKKITVSRNNRKYQVALTMNMYQALRYSSITLKLDNNNIVLILPINNKIIKCASLGKTVWLNEREDTYKSLQCTIESIEDINNNTVFDYESTFKHNNYGAIFKRFKQMGPETHAFYIDSYSHIYKSEKSMYKHAGDYATRVGMESIADVNIEFMLALFKTSLFEERKGEWLEGSIGKTIVADVKSEFNLADGCTLYQYRSVKRIALRNKLMSGGDRKLYIFELVDQHNTRLGVYISLYDIETLVDMCLNINKINTNTTIPIFTDKSDFDIVDYRDIIDIAEMCKGNKIGIRGIEVAFILAVHKYNGRYYIGLKIKHSNRTEFIPVIQIGELDVALEFIENTNKYGVSNLSMSYLYQASLGIINNYMVNRLGMRSVLRYSFTKYKALKDARRLCIEGESNISEYNKLGLPEIIKRSMGYNG